MNLSVCVHADWLIGFVDKNYLKRFHFPPNNLLISINIDSRSFISFQK